MSDNSAPLDFDFDTTTADTSFPELGVGEFPCVITDIERKPWNSNPDNSSLVISLQTTDSATSTKGTTLNPGFKTRFRVNLQNNVSRETGEPVGDYLRDLALLSIAITGQQARVNGEFCRAAIGKKVIAVVKKRSKPDDFGENEVKQLKQFVA